MKDLCVFETDNRSDQNSVDIVPNSVAQVAAAIEDQRGYQSLSRGPGNQYNQGRAFNAPRKRSLMELSTEKIPVETTEDQTHRPDARPLKTDRLENNPRHLGHHRVSGTSDMSNRLAVEDSSARRYRREQGSAVVNGPRLQRSTSGIGLERPKSSSPSNYSNGAGISQSIQHELAIARKRSREIGASIAWRNIAWEESEKMKTAEKKISQG